MSVSLKQILSDQIKTAMKSGAKETLTFGRSLHAAIRKKEIDDRVDLDDEGIVKIVSSLLKQRQDSITQFRQGNREDLVAKEEAEVQFLQTFLPPQMTEAEIVELVNWAVGEAKATSPKDMGSVMGLLKAKTQGRADGKKVSECVRTALAALK